MFVSCLWCAFSPNMKSISAATFFLGMGASPLLRSVFSQFVSIIGLNFDGIVW